jgi:Dit-like phage tail protein
LSDIPPDLLTPPPGSLAVADSPGLPLTGPQWGIFGQDNSTIIAVDSIGNVDYARDYHISDYPQEKGAFQSYNKVKVPYQAKIGFLISEKRADFLNAIEAAVGSLNFVTVVTPEIQYPSANLTHYSYRRDARHGRTLIQVDVWCEEVRIVAAASQTATQSTNATSPSQGGQQQPIDTTPKEPQATVENPDVGTTNSVGSGFTANAPTTDPEDFSGPNETLPAAVPNMTGGASSSYSTEVKSVIANRTLNPIISQQQ